MTSEKYTMKSDKQTMEPNKQTMEPDKQTMEPDKQTIENFEILFRQEGIGYLILKSRTRVCVGWEVDILSDGSLANGVVRGDEADLEVAAQDGCAILELSAATTAAINIDSHAEGIGCFTTLMVSSVTSTFEAQTIVGSEPISNGDRFVLAFASAGGERFEVTVPTIVMRDYVPILQKTLSKGSNQQQHSSFVRIPTTWRTATTASYPLVCVVFDEDEPVALSPEDARDLAAELLEHAKRVEARPRSVQ
jgi:hypothetical protein